MKVLGISCFYHDAAVAAVEDDRICFAIQEERLSRIKHDPRFPTLGIAKALDFCGWRVDDLDLIVFYENPDLKLRRLYDQVVAGWPRSWRLYCEHLPRFYRDKYPIERIVQERLGYRGEVRTMEHHFSHAASAFFTSSFGDALIVSIDGVGEFETTAVYYGQGNRLQKVASIHFPDSLGLLYSVLTQYLGFEVNEGEYKVMGLASYGTPAYVDRILGRMIHLYRDGSFALDHRYFDFLAEDRHYTDRFISEIGVPPRRSGDSVRKEHEDLAASIQHVLEEAIRNLLAAALRFYPTKRVCMAGGVALNCTANARLVRDFGIQLHIHPAAGDAGGSLGAALAVLAEGKGKTPYRVSLSPYLGVDYSASLIEDSLVSQGVPFRRIPRIAREIAQRLMRGDVVGLYQGRDEWGPRALGNRSILADPRRAEMKDHLNAKIKFREEFRPFAPVVMEEQYSAYFDDLGMSGSPHMLYTHRALRPGEIPAVVHIDNTSRVQTVTAEQNPLLYEILSEFYAVTGVPVLINTSFNLKGEPIVSSPSDALKTFFASGLDALVLDEYLIEKGNATEFRESTIAGTVAPIGGLG
jgi:carbamoyltransferase